MFKLLIMHKLEQLYQHSTPHAICSVPMVIDVVAAGVVKVATSGEGLGDLPVICAYMCVHMYVYIYIYMYREREMRRYV